MRQFAPVLLLAAVLLPACTNDHSPTEPRPDLPNSVTAPPMALVPPRPVQTPVPEAPPSQVLKFNPSPAAGASPFVFAVNQCLSQAALPGYPLDFSYDYGDGTQHGGRGICRNQHTYTRGGNFHGTFCVTDRVPGHRVCTQLTVSVS